MPNINQLQPFQRLSGVYQALFGAETEQINQRQSGVADLVNQMFVDTATWGLAIYEKELGIVTDTTQSYDERRSVIKSKMRGVGTVNATLIKLVADSYTNGNVDVSIANSVITVTYTSIYGIPPNESQLEAMVDEIKPAHLGVTYVFLYIRYSQLDNQYTYADLNTSGFTYADLTTQLPPHTSTALTLSTQ